VVVLALFLTACTPAATPAPTTAPQPTTAPPPTTAPQPTTPPLPTTAPTTAPEPTAAAEFLACEVTDTGGIDDKSFNATAWAGAERAMDELGIDAQYLESQQQTDYDRNISEFVQKNCDIIVTVGFLLGVATAKGAQANPDIPFAIVDYSYPDCFGEDAKPGETCGSAEELPNVLGLTFSTDQAAFLAGYAAAAATKTGKVGTFGGIAIPPVTIFMVGFTSGVEYYNEQHNANVEVLGWNNETQEGLFTGNFDSQDDGRSFAESLMQEGADIIMPVAGPVGLGSAAAVQAAGDAWIIGVDTDWTVSASEYEDIIFTSVLKNIHNAVFDAIKQVHDGEFESGVYLGTLENDGVGIAEFKGAAGELISDEIKAELQEIREGIIAGEIETGWPLPQP
jgi:basic membrane protein A